MPWDILSRVQSFKTFAQYRVQREPGKLGCNLECFPNNVTVKPCKAGTKSLIVSWVILDLLGSMVLLLCRDVRVIVRNCIMNVTV
jgi:hypothetical protein